MSIAGLATGANEGMAAILAQQEAQSRMYYQQQQFEEQRKKAERDQQISQASGYAMQGAFQPPPPQPPMPGQPSQATPHGAAQGNQQLPPGGMAATGPNPQMPPSQPPQARAFTPQPPQMPGGVPNTGMQLTPGAGQGKPMIPSYRTVDQAPPPSQPTGAPPNVPPQVAPATPTEIASTGMLQNAIKNLKQNGVPPDQWSDALKPLIPYMQESDKVQFAETMLQIGAEREARLAAEQYIRDNRLDAAEKAKEGNYASLEESRRKRAADESAGKPVDKATIDFYAKQSLGGDNSWQVGLARGKVGQKLIAAVKDRIPQLAKENDMSPQDVSTTKATRDSLNKALNDRQKYVAAGTQFVTNFKKQADLVEKYLKPGAAGGEPIINKWIQAGRKSVAGDADVTAFDNAVRGLTREHQRIVTGVTSNAQLHASSQETADQLLNIAQTPEQVRAALKEIREEAQNAIDSGNGEVDLLKTQLKTLGTTSSDKPTSKTGDPSIEAILKKHGV